MARTGLVREQFAALPERVLHWQTLPADLRLGAWFLATRRELIAASKLAAAIRRRIEKEPDHEQRRALRGRYLPRVSQLSRDLYSHRRMIWCGDYTVFAWSWRWACPKAARTVAAVYALADELGVTWPPEEALSHLPD